MPDLEPKTNSLAIDQPIGVFDSGVGGLTVVREIQRMLPFEDIVYLGDTARVPYGTKSPATVIRFACEDTQFLVQQKVKVVVVACNTVSAWALPTLNRSFGVPILGVIQPGVEAAVSQTRNSRIGVIGTNATIRSRAYLNSIKALRKTAQVYSRACPLLVPLVEEGWTSHPVTLSVLREYLAPFLARGIDTLVLGCTHYPLLKRAIRKVAGSSVRLVDSAESCAQFIARHLAFQKMLRPDPSRKGVIRPFVTDDTERFKVLAHRFLRVPSAQPQKVELQSYPNPAAPKGTAPPDLTPVGS